MALIADAHPSVAHCSGYTAHPSYHLPRKTNSIHHHQCPRRLEGDSYPHHLDFSSQRHQCLRMRESVDIWGLMFSPLQRDHHRLSVLPATKRSTGEESHEDVISHQSPQLLFSLGTTVLITQPSYDYNRCLLGPPLGN